MLNNSTQNVLENLEEMFSRYRCVKVVITIARIQVFIMWVFSAMKQNDEMLSPDMTLDKLIRLLEDNNFKSGSHADYYDE